MKFLNLKYTIAGLFFLAFTPYIYLYFFVHPSADDFVLAYEANNLGYWGFVKDLYYNWSGRYTANVLWPFVNMIYTGLAIYRVVLFSLFVFSFASFYYFFRVVFNRQLSTQNNLALSMCALLLYLFNAPDLAEGMYWYTSTVCYQTSCVTTLWMFSMMIDFSFNKKYFIHKYISFALIFSLSIFSIGLNEVVMLVIISVYACIIAYNLYNKKYKTPYTYLLFITGIICSLIVIVAPGNFVRGSFFTENGIIVKSFLMSFLQVVRFVAQWISNLPFLFFTFLFTLFCLRNIQLLPKTNHIKPIWMLLALPALVFCCVFPAYYATGIMGQQRTVNVAYFLFIALAIVNVVVIVNQYHEKLNRFIISEKQSHYLLIVAIIACCSTYNGSTIFTDIFYGKIKGFNKEMNIRYALLEDVSMQKKTSATIFTLQNKPESLYILDITTDSTFWVNQGYALYYNLKFVNAK